MPGRIGVLPPLPTQARPRWAGFFLRKEATVIQRENEAPSEEGMTREVLVKTDESGQHIRVETVENGVWVVKYEYVMS